jgi:hypothetical protein
MKFRNVIKPALEGWRCGSAGRLLASHAEGHGAGRAVDASKVN